MLLPKKTKYRKVQRGRRARHREGPDAVAFGDYGLKSLEPAG
jgi:large subunit ribosomal protein L16